MNLVDTTIGWRFVNPRMAENYSTESMGETARERRGALRRVARGPGRLRARVARARWPPLEAGASTTSSCRSTIRTQGRRGDRAFRRGPADRHVARAPGRPAPIFRDGGTVTAGNSSPINDGAACLVAGSPKSARSSWAASRWPASWPPARRASTPHTWASGPIPASRKALARAGLAIDDIDLVELNEAFAAQSLACARELGIPHEKLNVNGGAIALGHPLGCSGARLLSTLCWRDEAARSTLRIGDDVHRRGPGPRHHRRESRRLTTAIRRERLDRLRAHR